MELGMGNSLWHLIAQSDSVSKLVLCILLCMSIGCWAVFFCKLALVHIKKRQLRAVANHFKHGLTLQELLVIATHHTGTLPGYFLSNNLAFLNMLLKSNQSRELNEAERDMVLYHMDQSVDSLIEYEKNYLSILSTAAGVAPLLGLFGTVWGLVHAFMRISEKQVADITTVAPGIAEALMTTLAGLLVAIPALVMFNYLQVQVRAIGQQLIVLADQVGVIVQQLALRKMHAQNEASSPRSNDASGPFSHTAH